MFHNPYFVSNPKEPKVKFNYTIYGHGFEFDYMVVPSCGHIYHPKYMKGTLKHLYNAKL